MQINHGVLKFFARLEKKRNLLYRKGMLQYRGDVCRIRPEYRISCNFWGEITGLFLRYNGENKYCFDENTE